MGERCNVRTTPTTTIYIHVHRDHTHKGGRISSLPMGHSLIRIDLLGFHFSGVGTSLQRNKERVWLVGASAVAFPH